MSKRIRMNDALTVGSQPEREEFSELHDRGFQTIVNFRTTVEEDAPLSPEDERQLVEEAGMHYLHFPVSLDKINSELVDQFRDKLESVPEPIYAHCKSGKRAGAMFMMHIATEKGMTGQRTLEQAEQMGFGCDKPALREFVRSYIDEHSSAHR
ncbi:Beta-lactamase hydrolase-like protein [Polystyrenella longa]|uniref:Beta-lactamase hydrolase-like protein n=1 Tax=Polystyrenella longa TaxID=2528007 RepID=A0A518CL96_9PLAN|nr:protein tyrosine phosphatase family protein [Polystyrenella longa]QDU80000.1 Beta-lactamase hydrolase-like protein [Polystyrenella longa]